MASRSEAERVSRCQAAARELADTVARLPPEVRRARAAMLDRALKSMSVPGEKPWTTEELKALLQDVHTKR